MVWEMMKRNEKLAKNSHSLPSLLHFSQKIRYFVESEFIKYCLTINATEYE